MWQGDAVSSRAPIRLVVHVGSPKTGTSYLQTVLEQAQARRPAGAADVVMLPAGRQDAFWLMQDVRGRLDPARDAPRAAGALDRFRADLAALVERGEAATVLLSEEQLGAATTDQVRRLLDCCGDPDQVEVHVVVTSRALSRSVPSYWQQQLQVGARITFGDYCAQVREHQEGFGSRFWRAWDPTSILERWTPLVPQDRFHVVTVPRGGAPDELLHRFCRVLGVPVPDLDGTDRPRNPSLGWAQAEVLRQVNTALPERLRHRRAYRMDGKQWLGLTHLAAQKGDRIALPLQWQDWCADQTARVVAGLADVDVDVVGDLADLRVEAADFVSDELVPDDAALRQSAVDALASIVVERADARTARKAAAAQTQRQGGGAARWARAAARRVRRALPGSGPGGRRGDPGSDAGSA
jgi:hypothetical protein